MHGRRGQSVPGTCPVMATMGTESSSASASPVTRFVAPGPLVAMQTPTSNISPCAHARTSIPKSQHHPSRYQRPVSHMSSRPLFIEPLLSP